MTPLISTTQTTIKTSEAEM